LLTQNHYTKRITLADVARVSGFSISTVSLVLNEAPLSRYVAASTKEHIRAVASKLGYRPDAAARSLRSRRSHTIGIMVSDISDPFCTLILQGIEKALHPTTYLPIIMIAHNQRKQFGRHLEMLMERRVEGLILVANWLFGEFDQLADIRKSQIPMVGVGRDLTASRVRSVQVDNEAGGYAAAQHLYDLGHRKIAVLIGPSELADSDRRWNGIQRFAAEVGLTIAPELVGQLSAADDPTSEFEGGYRLISSMIEKGAEFTAVIAFDDLTGLGAIRALRQAGRHIPKDCSIIGFDDIPHAAVNTPGLTTIRQPMEQMGSMAAKWVLDSLADTKSHAAMGPSSLTGTLHLLPPELVIRQSTARRLVNKRATPVTRLSGADQGRARRKK
jgi:LacI family transcriptional regulator, galactose operon repressor